MDNMTDSDQEKASMQTWLPRLKTLTDLAWMRLILSVFTAAFGIDALYEGSGVNVLFNRSGWPAYISAAGLILASLVSMADLCLNDLSTRVRAPRCKQCRHLVWMWISITYCGYAVVSARAPSHELFTTCLIFFGVLACRIAFLDARTNLHNLRQGIPE